MKKIFCLITVFCLFSSTALAGSSTKTITLTDGSALKGKIMDYDNGIYTIKTNNLGVIRINEEKIESISSKSAPIVPQTQQIQSTQGLGGLPQGDSMIMQQAQALQGKVMSDPEMMENVEQLMNDPEVMQMLSDPSFINSIMSGDPNQLMGNEKLMKLMENPVMKAFVEKMQAQGMVPQQGMGY